MGFELGAIIKNHCGSCVETASWRLEDRAGLSRWEMVVARSGVLAGRWWEVGI